MVNSDPVIAEWKPDPRNSDQNILSVTEIEDLRRQINWSPEWRGWMGWGGDSPMDATALLRARRRDYVPIRRPSRVHTRLGIIR